MEPAGWPLTGRTEELDLLARAAASGSVLVGGRAGVGKTRLVREWAATVATSRPVVDVAATASTATIPFGAFAAWVPDGLDAPLQGAATLRRVADELVGGGTPVVVVDDAHLLDDPSAALVLHLARHSPATVVATVRSGEPVPDAVAALGREPVGTRLDLRDLSAAEVATLVESRLGDRVHPVAHQRVWTLSLGNPMYVREVIDAGLSEGHLRRDQRVWSWEGDLPGTPRLVELVGQRIGRVEAPDERRALELVAFGEPLPLALLSRLVDPERIQDLEARRLIAVRSVGGRDVVAVVHPLYGEVLRAATSPLTARRLHADLALAAHGLDPPVDPLRLGVWAVEAGAADASPALLLEAALRAAALRDDALALRLADAALAAGAGTEAVLLRARCLGDLGRDDEQRALIAELASDPDARVRAEAAEMQAFRLVWDDRDTPGALQVLADALERTPPGPDARLAATAAAFASHESDIAATLAATARTVSSPGADDALRLRGLTIAGYTAALRGEPGPALAVIQSLMTEIIAVSTRDPEPAGFAAAGHTWALLLDGRLDEAELFYRAILGGLDLTQEPAFRALPSLLLGRVLAHQGRVVQGAELIADAVDLHGHDSRYWFGRPALARAELAVVLAQTGDHDGAARALAGAEEEGLWTTYAAFERASALTWVAASAGELGRAAEAALASADDQARLGTAALEVVALADAVRVGAAREAAPRLAVLAERLGLAWPRAVAHAAEALATEDPAALDAASTGLEATGLRLAAAEVAAQAALHHAADGQRRRAAAARARAQDLLAWCGPARTPLLTDLDDPLAASLTAREREIALMATAGRSNREVADALGLSVRTVNSHLNHAYAKLGTSDRAELATRLGGGGPR
jgi:DNA-binding CsgD family transcriptional regulator